MFFQILCFEIGAAAYLWMRLIHGRLRYAQEDWNWMDPRAADSFGPCNPAIGATDGNSRKKQGWMEWMTTKGFKHRLDIIIGHFNWQVTHKHRTEWLVSCGNWYRDVTKERNVHPSSSSSWESEVLDLCWEM